MLRVATVTRNPLVVFGFVFCGGRFVGSRCAALIYEVVWFEMLRLVIGASAISLAVLLASFMGGMFLGSLLFPRLVKLEYHPLKLYAILELGIGICGIAFLFMLPSIRKFYSSYVGHGYAGIMLRALIGMACLLPPTILMGATLPAIARWMETSKAGIAKLGLFYAANIVGAVCGCLLAGFYLLRVHDMTIATLFALALNVIVAVIAFALAAKSAYQPTASLKVKDSTVPTYRLVYVAIALSGLTALGAEVVWTRLLSLLFGATVYTFSIILAIFLAGLGIGSHVGAYLSRHLERPRIAFAWCQLLLVALIPISAFMICKAIPFWYLNPSYTNDVWPKLFHDLMRTAVATLPAACLWGASFPLALAAAAKPGQDPGRLVGGIYAANTVGAILGSLIFGMLMIPSMGTQHAQQVLTLLASLAAILLFGSAFFSPEQTETEGASEKQKRNPWNLARAGISIAIVIGLAAGLTKIVPPIPPGMISYGWSVDEWYDQADYLHVAEGVNSSVAVSELEGDILCFHVGGKVVASNDMVDMRLQRMLGHIPALIHPEPKSVLIVGCGAGVTAGSFVLHPSIERIVICEIESEVPKAAAAYFAKENYSVISDPRTEVIHDDARHYIATTKEKFDIITSDPIHPWVWGAATMYTTEYFELCKERLNPGGIVTQWVPLYETSEAAVKSELGTFFEAFPDGTIWNSDIFGQGYDIVILGQNEPSQINVNSVAGRVITAPDIFRSLDEVELGTDLLFLVTFAGQGANLTEWLADAQINHDKSLRLQYLAGLAVNLDQSDPIFQAIVKERKYPENLFQASGFLEDQLRSIFDH